MGSAAASILNSLFGVDSFPGKTIVKSVRDWINAQRGQSDSKADDSQQSVNVNTDINTEHDATTPEDIKQKLEQQYKDTLANVQKDNPSRTSFNGVCGAFTYRQMLVRGIASKKDPSPGYGKDYFSTYKNISKTSEGYNVTAYEGSNAVRNIVNAHPNEVIENVVVSFNQKAVYYPSEAGHVLMISAIKDGNVYFLESSSQTIDGVTYPEGTPIILSLDRFMSRYPDANGAIHFTK